MSRISQFKYLYIYIFENGCVETRKEIIWKKLKTKEKIKILKD